MVFELLKQMPTITQSFMHLIGLNILRLSVAHLIMQLALLDKKQACGLLFWWTLNDAQSNYSTI